MLHTSKGKDILLFLLFLLVSYGFWLTQELNDEEQRSFELELRIGHVPSDVKFISDVPSRIHISVRDKGIELLRYKWSGTPQITVNYDELTYDEHNDRVSFSNQLLLSKLHTSLPASATILTCQPDSLSITVTKRAPTPARVYADVEITPSPECVISGPVTVNPDTVLIYSGNHAQIPSSKIHTEKLIRSGVKDTLHVSVSLLAPQGTMAEPSRVKVTVPVEPLMSKSREVPVQVINYLGNANVVTFPSRVRISYLIPKSLFNKEKEMVNVVADFTRRSGSRLPIRILNCPDYYHAVEIDTDSIDFMLEKPIVEVENEKERH